MFKILFILSFSLISTLWLSNSYGQERVPQQLNLSFERLDSSSKPVTNLLSFLNSTGKNGNKFFITADSIDRIDGKYSMVVTADTNAMNLENDSYKLKWAFTAHIGFNIWGDSLRNRHVKVVAYLKRYFPGPGTASLFYNKFPTPSGVRTRPMYRGKTNLLGIENWKEYTLEFDTDSVTSRIIFGATLILASYGYIKVDDFKVYIDGERIYNSNYKGSEHNTLMKAFIP